MPGRGLLGHAALQQVREAAAELDHLEPARHLAHRVGEHLAVLGASGAARSPRGARERARGSRRRARRACASESARQAGNACLAPPGRRGRPPRRSRSRRRPTARPSPGCRPARCGPTARRTGCPAIQWLIGLTAAGASTTSRHGVSSSRRPGSVARVAVADGADARRSWPRSTVALPAAAAGLRARSSAADAGLRRRPRRSATGCTACRARGRRGGGRLDARPGAPRRGLDEVEWWVGWLGDAARTSASGCSARARAGRPARR